MTSGATKIFSKISLDWCVKSIRIVNTSPSKVIYLLSQDESTNAHVNPNGGVIEPYGFALINVKFLTKSAKYSELTFLYKRLGLSSSEPKIFRRKLILHFTDTIRQNPRLTWEYCFFFILKSLRALLLLLLITYNVLLIKQNLHKY